MGLSFRFLDTLVQWKTDDVILMSHSRDSWNLKLQTNILQNLERGISNIIASMRNRYFKNFTLFSREFWYGYGILKNSIKAPFFALEHRWIVMVFFYSTKSWLDPRITPDSESRLALNQWLSWNDAFFIRSQKLCPIQHMESSHKPWYHSSSNV